MSATLITLGLAGLCALASLRLFWHPTDAALWVQGATLLGSMWVSVSLGTGLLLAAALVPICLVHRFYSKRAQPLKTKH